MIYNNIFVKLKNKLENTIFITIIDLILKFNVIFLCKKLKIVDTY